MNHPMTHRIFILLALLGMAACSSPVHQVKEAKMTSDGELTVPVCPDWSETDMANFNNGLLSNFGCSHAINHTLMLENPYDMIESYTDNSPDAERAAAVVQLYRQPVAAEGEEEGGEEAATPAGEEEGS